jgi:hypothetical protein
MRSTSDLKIFYGGQEPPVMIQQADERLQLLKCNAPEIVPYHGGMHTIFLTASRKKFISGSRVASPINS